MYRCTPCNWHWSLKKSWWVWNDRKCVSQLTQVVMMANICLQTYLVSNLSALLTRADVGIYTMRCLVLLSTNEALEVSTAMCLVILGWIMESALEVFTAISSQWMCVSAMLTALQQFWLVRFFEPILSLKDASKMQCLEVRWCSIWFWYSRQIQFFSPDLASFWLPWPLGKELRQLSVFSKTFGLPKHVKDWINHWWKCQWMAAYQ